MVSTDSTGFSTYSRKWEVESEKADYTNWNRTQETEELNNFHSFFNIFPHFKFFFHISIDLLFFFLLLY